MDCEAEGSSSTSNTNDDLVKPTKYYKQTYRVAWEQISDFAGWLKSVPGQPNRAFCLYCKKSLHAHRLSLLKHTCTIRHQKAAQLHCREQEGEVQEFLDSISCVETEFVQSTNLETDENIDLEAAFEETDNPKSEAAIIDSTSETVKEDKKLELFAKDAQKSEKPKMTTRPPISTHVLDTAKGMPVSGLQVSLYKLIDGRWTYINEGMTNPDGRFNNFINQCDFTAGRYKLHFDVDRYFELRKQESLYPFIEIVFDCRSPQEHYHVPLLMSPYGYTTYRGS